MTQEEIAGLKQAFSESLMPIWQELKAIHQTLDEHGKLLQSIDGRLNNVEGILDGVEVLIRKKTG